MTSGAGVDEAPPRREWIRFAAHAAGAGALAVAATLLAEGVAASAGPGELAATVGLGLAVGGALGLLWGALAAAVARLPRSAARLVWPAVGALAGLWLAWRLGAFARLASPQYRTLAIATLAAAPGYGLVAGVALALAQPGPQLPAGRLRRLGPRLRRGLALLALGTATALAVADARLMVLASYPAAPPFLRFGTWLATAFAIAALAPARAPAGLAGETRRARLLRGGAAAVLALVALAGSVAMALRSPADAQSTLARRQAGQALAIVRALTDLDGDGYSSLFGGGDCAAWDPAVSPGAIELAGNGVDDNCQRGDAPAGVTEAGQLADAPLARGPTPCSVALVTIDSVRLSHTSLAGYARDTTPVLRQLGAQGTVFDNAFSTGSWTSIAISTLHRGRFARRLQWTGVYETNRLRLVRPGLDALGPRELVRLMFALPLDDPHATLAEWLQRRGMRTIGVVNDGPSEFLSEKLGTGRGFDRFATIDDLPYEQRVDAVVVDRALAQLAEVPADQPFFLWVHLYAPHFPNEATPGVPDWGDALVDGYDEELRYADDQLGRIVAALDARGGLPVGLVVAADHGEKLGASTRLHGVDLDEASLRIPLVVRGCGFGPRRVSAPASLVDVVPTVLAMTHTPAPPWLDGVDLAAPPAERLLHADLWRYDARGEAVYDVTGVTDGTAMFSLDLLNNTPFLDAFEGRPAPAADLRARLDEAARAYLEATGGRLLPK